jgi:uncharacterized protein (TIGR03437 family)
MPARTRSLLVSLAGVLCCATLPGQTYTISTIAGNGSAAYSGDNSPAADSQFNLPTGIAIDSAGNIFIADTVNHRIREILASNGNIKTVAGNGTAGYTGDKGQAASAELNQPSGVAVDGSGNLYIADTNNHVIRKVTSGGVISTFAGNNQAGSSGDGGAANVAQLNSPTAVALDSANNVYIADTGNNTIRVVAPNGNINTIIGTGNLTKPTSIAVDASGVLYLTDPGNNRVAKFTGGRLTIVAGTSVPGFSNDGGQATAAQLNNPKGVAVDAAGNLYITDTNNCRIRKVTPDGVITTIAGNAKIGYTGDGGPATAASLSFPYGLALDASGNIYFTDSNNHALRELQPAFPVISQNGVGNAASGLPQISPGALASVYGTNFAGAEYRAQSLPLGTSMGGVTVTVNGVPAPLLYVGPTQINFQVPWSTQPGTGAVVVSVAGGASNSASVPVKAAGPGLFYQAANGFAIAANFPSNTLNGAGNPAPAGSTIIAYLTGSGPVSNTPADGAAASSGPLSTVSSSFSAAVGSAPAEVTFLGLAPGFVGVVQANITVPAGLAPGTYPLTVTIGGETSNAASIAVK